MIIKDATVPHICDVMGTTIGVMEAGVTYIRQHDHNTDSIV